MKVDSVGLIYFTGSLAKVYAVDAKTGVVKWTYDPQVWKHNPDKMHFSFGANRGMAYENGKVFAAALDGRLFALDAKTGKELWVAKLDASANTVPSTYLGKDGKQYVAVAASGNSFLGAPVTSDAITAFRLK